MSRFIAILLATWICASLISTTGAAAPVSEAELKARVESATKNLSDLTGTVVVLEKNKAALTKVEPSISRVYELQSASISFKVPDSIRVDSKLGMVKVSYISAGGMKIFRAPKVKIDKVDNYSGEPAKLQSPLDLGIVTPQLWQNRRVEIVDDPEAEANGEIKLKLCWLKGDMVNLIWIDATNLWLKRFEKRDSRNNLLIRVVYSNPKNIGGVIWLPTRVDIYASDGAKAGSSELTDIKINTNLPDTLFK